MEFMEKGPCSNGNAIPLLEKGIHFIIAFKQHTDFALIFPVRLPSFSHRLDGDFCKCFLSVVNILAKAS